MLSLHAYLFQCSSLEVNSVEDTEQQEQRFRLDTCIKIINIFFFACEYPLEVGLQTGTS